MALEVTGMTRSFTFKKGSGMVMLDDPNPSDSPEMAVSYTHLDVYKRQIQGSRDKSSSLSTLHNTGFLFPSSSLSLLRFLSAFPYLVARPFPSVFSLFRFRAVILR